jgi:hypothetical protein
MDIPVRHFGGFPMFERIGGVFLGTLSLGILFLVGLVLVIPDSIRYIKMRSM